MKTFFKLLLAAVLVGLGLNFGINFWVFKRLEKQARTPIRGTFLPQPWGLGFRVKNPQLNWQDQFQIVSGEFRVQYDLESVLRPGRLRAQMEGEDFTLRFSEKLAAAQGLAETRVEKARADLIFSKGSPPEILLLELYSPELQFRLAPGGENAFGNETVGR